MSDPFDEKAQLRADLAPLGPSALADLRHVLEGPQTYREALLRQFVARDGEAALLRAIRDLDA